VAGSTALRVRDPFGGSSNVLGQGRLMFGVRLFERFAFFGGPTCNVYLAGSERDRYALTPLPSREQRMNEFTTLRYWPGVQLGIRM